MNSKRVGNMAEAKVLAAFVERGWSVCIPFGDTEPYDLVVDRGNGFERVQVKTARLKQGRVEFRTSSIVTRRKGEVQALSYHGRADVFAAYCHELDKVYVVPVSEAAQHRCTLRLSPALNGQSVGVRIADGYVI